MTPRTWAAKLVERTPVKDGETDAQFMERLVLNQHARAVRIVTRLKRKAYFEESSFDVEQFDAYIGALDDILAALQRGRGGKG